MGGLFSSSAGDKAEKEKDKEEKDKAESPHVKTFSSLESWQTHFDKIKDFSKLVVIDFTAAWCPPCKLMAPVFEELMKKFTEDEFIKIDVDQLSDVAKEFKVEAMPTFVLWKEGKEVDRVVGANKDELDKKVHEHQTTIR